MLNGLIARPDKNRSDRLNDSIEDEVTIHFIERRIAQMMRLFVLALICRDYIFTKNLPFVGSFSYFYVIMLRQIITPLEPSFTLQFPSDMLGKTIEIIAFELKEQRGKSQVSNDSDKMLRLKRIEDLTKDKLVDLSNFKFNRDEANDYGE